MVYGVQEAIEISQDALRDFDAGNRRATIRREPGLYQSRSRPQPSMTSLESRARNKPRFILSGILLITHPQLQ